MDRKKYIGRSVSLPACQLAGLHASKQIRLPACQLVCLIACFFITLLLTLHSSRSLSFAADKLVVKQGDVTKFVVKDDGKVGIGTGTPTAKLQIGTVTPPNINTPWDFYSYNNSYGRVGIDSGINNAGLEFLEGTVRKWFIGSYNGKYGVWNTPGGGWAMVINSSNYVGIGTSSPVHLLQVGTGSTYSDGNGWIYSSSREYKDNIQQLSKEDAMLAFNKLDPVTFKYKTDSTQTHVGFIAEDVPDLVATKDRKGLNPLDIVALLTRVIQEQQKTIGELSEKVNKLEKQIQP